MDSEDEIKILYISAYYVHKNFECLPYVAEKIKEERPDLKFRFVITLPEEMPETKSIFRVAKSLGVEDNIETRGAVAVADAVKLYEECSMAFIPALLETFSATYPEAMAAGLPIVASDYDFSKNKRGPVKTLNRTPCTKRYFKNVVSLLSDTRGHLAFGSKDLRLLSRDVQFFFRTVTALTRL